ncbi:MAG: SDR family oxidoreductase, partial [Oribacterium sp.]|nr:SDR family oxidoreductase [Oribacterium sp.]
VKLRGLRVELGEIESVMATYPSIRTAVVIVAHGETDYLAAYFTADEKIDIEKLKKHISQYLTAYMVPQAFMQLDSMPMTANGKVDKKALPEINKVISNKIIKQPENELQKRLCGLFSKALNMEVGIDDDFFEMGGTSLTAAKVLMGAKVQNIPMEYQDIFDARTVEKLELILRHRDSVNVEYESAQHDDKNDERTEAEKVSEHRTYENPEIEKVLAHNTREFVSGIKAGSLGDVLLTGATGFMGIHVLKEIIDHSNCRIICLVNGKKKGNAYISGESRLRLQLFYYFDNAYEELFGNRIFVKESDITDSEAIAALEGEYFDTVINCAASVKHFADFNFLRQVNVDGVENLINLCIRKKARLIHLSTSSVCGEAVDGVSSEDVFKECSLDVGQDVTSNAYVHTKYLAEEKVLKAVAEQGLDGKIMRLGNLMSRQEDGEFQINFRTNNFMNTLRAYAVLGCIPYSELDDQTDFSPIDETARAVVHLAGTPSDFTVFHVYNSHEVDMADVVAAMDLCGLYLDAVTDEAFAQRLREGLADDDINAFLSPLINYDLTDDNRRQDIACDNRFTVQALGRLGIRWSITDMEYLEKVIEMLQTLGFFDIK